MLPKKHAGMSHEDKQLLQGKDLLPPWCVICGRTDGGLNGHHVVPRSRGGKDGPRVSLCGFGNTSGCHKLVSDGTYNLV